jgi:hypothetical protein
MCHACALCAALWVAHQIRSLYSPCEPNNGTPIRRHSAESQGALMIGYDDLVYRCDKRAARITRFVRWRKRNESSRPAG